VIYNRLIQKKADNYIKNRHFDTTKLTISFIITIFYSSGKYFDDFDMKNYVKYKKMKTNVLGIILALMISMSGLSQENKTGVSQEQMQARVGQNIDTKIKSAESEATQQAVEVLKQTQEVIGLIAQKKNKEAEEKLAEVVGKLEVLLAKYPEMSLIPVDATVETKDVVADVKTVEKIMKDVQKAIDKGYYQQAKWILNDLSSEVIIKTAYLPMATYPDAMKLAAKLMHEGKNIEAVNVLVQALTTMVVQEEIIPLPVLRAEVFVKTAINVLQNEKTFKENKEQLLALLDAAEYQLKLAEAMGYGKKDKEYAELFNAITILKDHVNKSKERKTKKALKELEEKLKKFKERLFYNQNKK